MKTFSLLSLRAFAVGFLICVSSSAWTATLSLYPKAEVMDIPLITLSETDTFIQEAIARGADGRGWCSGLYKGPWVGFVKGTAVPAPNKVTSGTLIYAMPSTASMVLARIDAKDDVHAEPDPDWVQITLQKPIFLYFKLPNAMPQAAAMPAVLAPDHSSAALPRDLEGKLLTCGRTFMGARYDYQLVNSQGDCIALLDTSHCVIAGDMRSYIGQEVIVQGMIRDIGQSRTLRVTYLRLH